MTAPIARYWASLYVSVDKKSIALVDTTLNRLQQKLKNFGKFTDKNLKLNFDVGKFTVDERKLSRVLGDALDKVSFKTAFEVSRFTVNQRNLQASMQRAMRGMGSMQVNAHGNVGASGQPSQARESRSSSSYGRANYLHAGGAAGALARYGVASLPFVGGVYGLSRANTISQELQANELALRAVAGEKAGGYQEYLSSLGNRLGMTTRDLQPGFTQYLASAQGTALEPTIQRDFTNFTQYGAVMGLNPEQMKGSLKAITQMVSKQQIYAEELKGQLAERMPAAVRLMADAMTGGDTKALIKMMENGELDPNTALPKFFEEMRKRSEHMLPEYFKTSRFAQGSMNKAAEDQFKRFAKGGGDAGFARLFNSLATVMKEASPAVDAMAKGFNEISKYTSFAMLLPQSFKRAFEGRDSWVADALGEMNAKIVYDLGAGLGELASEITKTLGTAIDGWGLLLGVVGPAITDFLRRIKDIFLYTFKILNSFLPGGGGMDSAANASRALTASLNGASPEEVKAIAEGKDVKVESQAPPSPWATPISSTGGFLKDVAVLGTTQIAEKTGIAAWWENFTGLMKDHKPSDGDRASMDYQREMATSREKFKASQNNQVNIQSGAIVINANTSDPEALSDILMSKLKESSKILLTGQYTETLVSFPNTGG